MKVLKIASIAVASAAFALALGARADAGADVLKAKGCTNCHDPEKKKVGPSIKDIAAKDAGKSAELVTKLKEAKGHPKVNASEAEIKTAVDAMLSTK